MRSYHFAPEKKRLKILKGNVYLDFIFAYFIFINTAKRFMNNLHFEMGQNGFSELYVDQFDSDTAVVTRHNPINRESIILIARTAFTVPSYQTSNNLNRPLSVPSRISSVLFEANLVEKKNENNRGFMENSEYINGLQNYELYIVENVNNSKFISDIEFDGCGSKIHFKYFPVGTVIVFKVALDNLSIELNFINQSIDALYSNSIDNDSITLDKIFKTMSIDELNILLFRCLNEEASEQIGLNGYELPNYGKFIYCGFQGIINILDKQRPKNNLGHEIFENLRQGNWLMDYIVERLRKYYDLNPKYRANLLLLSDWLLKFFNALKKMPRYLLPHYFDKVITGLYQRSVDRCFSLINIANENGISVKNGSSFVKALSLASISLTGHIRDSPLPETIETFTGIKSLPLSMSAGLPHFSTSYMRNWGRDTFISIRGNF
jgi:glycogen debranching enzyme